MTLFKCPNSKELAFWFMQRSITCVVQYIRFDWGLLYFFDYKFTVQNVRNYQKYRWVAVL